MRCPTVQQVSSSYKTFIFGPTRWDAVSPCAIASKTGNMTLPIDELREGALLANSDQKDGKGADVVLLSDVRKAKAAAALIDSSRRMGSDSRRLADQCRWQREKLEALLRNPKCTGAVSDIAREQIRLLALREAELRLTLD